MTRFLLGALSGVVLAAVVVAAIVYPTLQSDRASAERLREVCGLAGGGVE